MITQKLKALLLASLFAGCASVSASTNGSCLTARDLQGSAHLLGKSSEEISKAVGIEPDIEKDGCSFGVTRNEKKYSKNGDRYTYLKVTDWDVLQIKVCFYNDQAIGSELIYKHRDGTFSSVVSAFDRQYANEVLLGNVPKEEPIPNKIET